MNYFFIFAGPNGSGKSTVIGNFAASPFSFYDSNDALYINADYYAKLDPVVKAMPEGREKDLAAWHGTNAWRTKALRDRHHNIKWETVFSHPGRMDVIREAKELGYFVILVYVTTIDPAINVERVLMRAAQGGHGVPEEKIRSRYERSVKLLPDMLDLADEALVYDNSYHKSPPGLIFGKIGGEYMVLNRDKMDAALFSWVRRNLVEPLEEKSRFCLVLNEEISNLFIRDHYP
ncbi:Uncharacterized protein-like protein [Methanocorpusculum labreanum Z]|uniref:Uncharacterized protein-like protein n=1 Tax=Methanocorpusculum labreanum (strain ATCC 43576 / DSM 4855 / Z) TaxID=410358 RepID=A2SRV2_METLZ|nr:AAA family ATPase [Methanocorpusculum labreanum]ABN07058.1 Uncharacterized protein-like protein [Methanocorpusculum labreanum Z]